MFAVCLFVVWCFLVCVVACLVFIVRRLLSAVCWTVLAGCCSLSVVHVLLFGDVSCCLLLRCCSLLIAGCCLLCAGRCLFVVGCSVFVVRCLLYVSFVVCWRLFVAR